MRPAPKLASVIADTRARDAALEDDTALVRYQEQWSAAIERMQRAHPSRWRVRGLSDDEVRDALTLRLLEVLRGTREEHAEYDHPEKPWGLRVIERELRALRERFRLDATPMDLSGAPLLVREEGQEARFLELETQACRALAERNARARLSRPQQRWLSAMTLAANAGAFFTATDRFNPSAASRLLGKNRSSALRAFRELQVNFRAALDGVTGV